MSSPNRVRQSVSQLAATFEASRAGAAHQRPAEIAFELRDSLGDDVLVVVADRRRVLGTRVHARHLLGRHAAPERFGGAALRLLIEKIEKSFAEATRDLDTREAYPRHGLSAAEASALERGGFDLGEVPAEKDSAARAAVEYAALLADCLSVKETAALLGVGSSRIRQRVGGAAPTILAIKIGARWRIPRFQFEGRRAVPGVERVVPRLSRTLHPLAVRRWFESPNPDLVAGTGPLSPRQWLLSGHPPASVAELAAHLASP